MTGDGPTPAVQDGRRKAVTCQCGNADLELDIDPLDDALFIHCPECEQDVAMGKMLKGDYRAHHSGDDTDPRGGGRIRHQLTGGDQR